MIKWQVYYIDGTIVQHGQGVKSTQLAAVQTARKWVKNNVKPWPVKIKYYNGVDLIRVDSKNDAGTWKKKLSAKSIVVPKIKPRKTRGISIGDLEKYDDRTLKGTPIKKFGQTKNINGINYEFCLVKGSGMQWVRNDNIVVRKKSA